MKDPDVLVQLNVRIPQALHRQLKQAALDLDLPLAMVIVSRLAQGPTEPIMMLRAAARPPVVSIPKSQRARKAKRA